MDCGISSFPSRSSEKRVARRWRRARMSDPEKIRQWMERHPAAINTQQLPADIAALSCGCRRSDENVLRQLVKDGVLTERELKRRLWLGLRVYREKVGLPWLCAKCGKNLSTTAPTDRHDDRASDSRISGGD